MLRLCSIRMGTKHFLTPHLHQVRGWMTEIFCLYVTGRHDYESTNHFIVSHQVLQKILIVIIFLIKIKQTTTFGAIPASYATSRQKACCYDSNNIHLQHQGTKINRYIKWLLKFLSNEVFTLILR